MARFSLLALLATLLVAFVAAELPPGCVQEDPMPNEQFDELHEKLANTPNKFPIYLRLYDLEQYVDSPEKMKGFGFSPAQTIKLATLFNVTSPIDEVGRIELCVDFWRW